MNRIIKKILFTICIAKLGADLKSKLVLFWEASRIQKNFYTKGRNRSFECYIGTSNRKVLVRFLGTIDELHALTEIFVERCYDPHTSNVYKILDLGANIGLASVWIWIEFPECTVHAYEPNPEVFIILEKNLSPLPKTRVFNMAISDNGPSIPFYLSSRSFSSSSYKIPRSKMITVKTKSLDQAIADLGTPVDMIKMDIEGAEFLVVKNSKNIGDVNVIVGEIHPEEAGDSKFFNLLSKHRVFGDPKSSKSIFYAVRKI